MNSKKFEKLLSEAIPNFKSNNNVQDFVLHNMGHLTSSLVNYKAMSNINLKFDFRDDYWFKTENRFFVKFCEFYFDKLTVNPHHLAEELLQISKVLKNSRQNGLIKDLPKIGLIESKNDFIKYGETISEAIKNDLTRIPDSKITAEHRGLNQFKNLLYAFKDFCISFPKTNKPKDLNGILKTRFRFLPYATASSIDELKLHAKYFAAIYGLFTRTNSYKVGGAQFFGPVIGNSSFTDLHSIYESWSNGKSIKEVPFLSHNSVSKSKADFSNTTPALEVYGYCNLDRYPIINNSALKSYQEYLELDETSIINSFVKIAEDVLDFYENKLSDADKQELKKSFDIYFKKSLQNFEASVLPEKFASENFKTKFYQDSLSKVLDDEFFDIAKKTSLTENYEKSLAMFHLLIDSNLYISKQAKKEESSNRKKAHKNKFWIYAAGERSQMWDEFYKEGIMAMGWAEIGDLSRFQDKDIFYKAYDETFDPDSAATNNKKGLWEFINVLKPGDIVFVKKGLRVLVGYGVVTSDYSYDASEKRFPHIKSVDWQTNKEVMLPEEMSNLVQKTLTDITQFEGYADELLALFDNQQDAKYLDDLIHNVASDENIEVKEYGMEDALDELFIEEKEFKNILESLELKKNIILEGPPGVGKTFIAKKIAKALMGANDESRIHLIQFHQSYAYEDFVQGYRPDGDGGFVLKNGIFYDLCQKAKANKEEKYFMVIDEINRGNLSKIFGELLMLIEADKRGIDYQVTLTYSNTGEKFSIPENLYIIGTMNTADRSISIIDYALRRRFRFMQLKPQFNNPKYKEHLAEVGVSPETINKVISTMNEINSRIKQDKRRLGIGYEIGHSYFCPIQKGKYAEEWFNTIMESEIMPLLKEYWFDDDKALEFLEDKPAA